MELNNRSLILLCGMKSSAKYLKIQLFFWLILRHILTVKRHRIWKCNSIVESYSTSKLLVKTTNEWLTILGASEHIFPKAENFASTSISIYLYVNYVFSHNICSQLLGQHLTLIYLTKDLIVNVYNK